jgi:hypothetical protein
MPTVPKEAQPHHWRGHARTTQTPKTLNGESVQETEATKGQAHSPKVWQACPENNYTQKEGREIGPIPRA